MLLLEINEFNPDLMRQAADELDADNLRYLLALPCSQTTTDDKEERFGLDPWVQWVSIHTGKTSAQHGVKHLGDVPQLKDKQIWETLSQRGLRCGVWGAMNASRGNTPNCAFFLPDPWTFSERACPPELNNLLAFPRYFSKNYGDLDAGTSAKELLKLMWYCLNPRIAARLIPIAPKLMTHLVKYGMPEYLLFALFDLVNATLFVHYHQQEKPDFSILFMNSLAHLQHHKWTSQDRLSPEMKIAFTLFDEVIGVLRKGIPDGEALIVTNAFTQCCSYDRNEYLYRQINPQRFLEAAGIHFQKVEQAMTNDGHVFFETEAEARTAAGILERATVNGKPAFHVEMDGTLSQKIFFQGIVWKPLPEDAVLEINDRSIRFFDQFEVITRRSGSHVQGGHAFYKNIQLPEKLYNHELHSWILKHFQAA